MEGNVADTSSSEVYIGTISTVRKSFGFIKSAALASEVFFHQSVCGMEGLAVGDAVGFVLDAQQQPGKKAAAKVWRSSQHCSLSISSTDTHYGIVSIYQATGLHGSGVLRYMDQQGKVQHLTFSSKDLEPSDGRVTLAPGSLVSFKVGTDMWQKALTEAARPPGPKAVHAYMRATQVQQLTDDSQVR